MPTFANPALGPILIDLARAAGESGGRLFLVGGAVRDTLLGRHVGDADCELFGVEAPSAASLLAKFGRVQEVGKAFAVFHLTTEAGPVEVALPRRERKTGPGHRGFAVEADPSMTPDEAARRRDFTINALLYDPLADRLIDTVGGLADLARGRLRHVSSAFTEDPLRVLRVGRFVSRFGFEVDPKTVALCRTLGLAELPPERLETEWRQILLHGDRPGLGLQALEDCGALGAFPEIAALRNVPQDPVWHAEGDVFHHTALCLDHAVDLRPEMVDPWAEMLGVLCHDFGKPSTTCFADGRWRSAAHDRAGEAPTRRFLERFPKRRGLADQVVGFVLEHIRPSQLYHQRHQVSDAAIRRLATRIDIPALVRVARADALGRRSRRDAWRAGDWLLARAEELGVERGAPQPLLQGRDLVRLGVEPGRKMGAILDRAYAAQLDGELVDREQALAWIATQLAS